MCAGLPFRRISGHSRDLPNPFLDSFGALLAAQALITATTVGLFDVLVEGPMSASGISAALGLDEVGTEALLGALISLGYVELSDGDGEKPSAEVRYRATPEAENLARSAEASIATFIGSLNRQHWELLGQLPEVIRGGSSPDWHDNIGPDRSEAYIRGLWELSRGEQAANARVVAHTAPRRLLDIAGGHGAFAAAMAELHPGLQAVVLDLPASIEVGRLIAAEAGYADRVRYQAGDAMVDALGVGWDVISMFNFVQHLAPAAAQELFRRAARALAPGGVLVIGETERPDPRHPASELGGLTGLLFYLMTKSRTYGLDEIGQWLESAGLKVQTVYRNPTSPWRVIVQGLFTQIWS